MPNLTVGIDIFLEFAEVFLHSVLYLKHVYHRLAFRKSVIYGYPVYRCTHRGVCDYIAQTVQAVRVYLDSDSLRSLNVLLLDETGAVCQTVELQVHLAMDGVVAASLDAMDDVWLLGLERSLASVLQRLYHVLPSRCTGHVASYRLQMCVAGSACPAPSCDSSSDQLVLVASPPTPASVLAVQSLRHELMVLQVCLLTGRQ